MSKIRLIQAGWEHFTGNFGTVDFVDGLSAGDVAPVLAKQLGNIVQVRTEDDKNPSASQQALDSRNYVPAASTMDQKGFERTPAAPAPQFKTEYSRDELEVIASDKGLKGLRDIATPLGLKANSIGAMIEGLLEFYKAKATKERELEGKE